MTIIKEKIVVCFYQAGKNSTQKLDFLWFVKSNQDTWACLIMSLYLNFVGLISG
jgi:hypothetical protein